MRVPFRHAASSMRAVYLAVWPHFGHIFLIVGHLLIIRGVAIQLRHLYVGRMMTALDVTSGFDPWRSLLATLDDFEMVVTPGSGAILYSSAYSKTELPRNLHAAAAAAGLRLKSLDNAKRSYTSEQPSRAETAESLFALAFRAAMAHMDAVAPNVIHESDGNEVLGEFAGVVALNRVKSGFRAANILYRVGYNYEADTIARQILEQIAWSIAVRHCTTQTELKAIQPQKSIGRLREVHPEAARLNGTLSDIAHAGLVRHQEALGPDDDGELQVRMAWSRLPESASNLLLLADAWVVAFELSQFNYLSSFLSVESSDPPTVKVDRTFAREIPERVAAIRAFDASERRAT